MHTVECKKKSSIKQLLIRTSHSKKVTQKQPAAAAPFISTYVLGRFSSSCARWSSASSFSCVSSSLSHSLARRSYDTVLA